MDAQQRRKLVTVASEGSQLQKEGTKLLVWHLAGATGVGVVGVVIQQGPAGQPIEPSPVKCPSISAPSVALSHFIP